MSMPLTEQCSQPALLHALLPSGLLLWRSEEAGAPPRAGRKPAATHSPTRFQLLA